MHSWKPYIILKALANSRDSDWLLDPVTAVQRL